MILVTILVLLVLATVIFHFASPWQLTEIASNWTSIDSTINITLWVTGFVFVAVNLFMALAIFRYRFRSDRNANYEPENKKLELWLTGITSVGIVAMLAPGLFVWADFVDTPKDADRVEVVGQQWHWSFRLPGEDGELGQVAARFIDQQNPFGVDPNDPKGQDDRLIFSNELHLPVNRPVEFVLRSKDVLHNFGVPQFRAKMDLIPGMESQFWVEPTRTGAFDIMCMELCGMAHHAMRGRVVVEDQETYAQWEQSHPTFAETQQPGPGNAEAGKPLYNTCSSCHGAQGQGNKNMNAPKISGLRARYLRRQLHYYKEGIRGAHEQDQYGQQMAGMMATLSDDQAIADVAAYIETFPDQAAEATLEGDAEKGRRYYSNCSSCHGEEAEGNYATMAPKLAGQHDWYLVRQLKNFKQGIRGSHPEDAYGSQMILMARTLHSEEALEDLASYINSLE